MRKKIDSRIRTLVENGVGLRQRSLFVIVGDKGRDQVVNLHYMLSKSVVKARPSVLWCYKKDLYLSSHSKKRTRQIKKMMQRGLLDPEKEDPFSLFVASTQIRYCYYADSQKILGNTYGMCVLQDFEALTPNLLARTIETVEGGGIVVMLLSSMDSLTQLYSLAMDVHARLRTDSHQDVTGRFNERLVLSLASNPNCIIMDDELNILPTSTRVKDIKPIERDENGAPILPKMKTEEELKELVSTLQDTVPAGTLVAKCRTLDQARGVMTFLDAASEKTLRSTVALTAARGRGKSAALGLAIAGSLALGYSNIFVTAPSPENLQTLFEFVVKGLESLDYKEHMDYDIVSSTNAAFNKAVIRLNIFKNHRQTVQYIQPQHSEKLAQAELLVIDEAAAIPLTTVKALLGPYLVFLCSTVNGYEGTGRSLSLKLIQQLRSEGAKLSSKEAEGSSLGRTFREVQLQEPIRYTSGDAVEAWLHGLLCLDAAEHLPPPPPSLPHPDDCQLFYVDRDTLFSYHKASEAFLQRAVSLFVASHYRNTPNDLVLMSDAPAHHLFALVGPVDETKNALPDILCVIQVALEGAISKEAALNSLAKGTLPAGDMIPWTVGQQFQDPEFPLLSGARIVRIAAHPEMARAGYGSKALQLLRRYYQGELSSLEEEHPAEPHPQNGSTGTPNSASGGLHGETLRPRQGLPPLLCRLADRPPERLQWLGVSYGLTQQLYNFWRRADFEPVYLRQAPSEVTGEHTIIMLSAMQSESVEDLSWLSAFVSDFKLRFTTLMAGAYRLFSPALALSILDPKLTFSDSEAQEALSQEVALHKPDGSSLTAYDFKRLQAYSNNLVDYHMVLDLLPPLVQAYLAGKIPCSLSYGQAAIFLCLGLQQIELSDIEKFLGLPSNQILALFNKGVRKLHQQLQQAREAGVYRTLPKQKATVARPHATSLDADLDQAALEAQEAVKAALNPAQLAQFSIAGRDTDFEQQLDGKLPSTGIVSIRSGASDRDAAARLYKKDKTKKRSESSKQKSGGFKKRKVR